jgi:hypothetical protein
MKELDQMLTDLSDFFAQLWTIAGEALRLNPHVLGDAASSPQGNLLIATMTVLAGASLLAGQSAILFVNQVKPGRFILSMLLYGIVFALRLGLLAAMLWLSAGFFFEINQPPGAILRIVGLSSAPLLFGFLIFLPYFGEPVEWALWTWSGLILLVTVQATFGATLGQALALAGLGWLLGQLVTRLLGRQLGTLRDRLWRAATGTPFDLNQQELIAEATAQLRTQLTASEAQEPEARPAS